MNKTTTTTNNPDESYFSPVTGNEVWRQEPFNKEKHIVEMNCLRVSFIHPAIEEKRDFLVLKEETIEFLKEINKTYKFVYLYYGLDTDDWVRPEGLAEILHVKPADLWSRYPGGFGLIHRENKFRALRVTSSSDFLKVIHMHMSYPRLTREVKAKSATSENNFTWTHVKNTGRERGWTICGQHLKRWWLDEEERIIITAIITPWALGQNPDKVIAKTTTIQVASTDPTAVNGWLKKENATLRECYYGDVSFVNFERMLSRYIAENLNDPIEIGPTHPAHMSPFSDKAEDIMKETSMRSVEPLINPITEKLKSSSSSNEASNTKNINQSLAGNCLSPEKTTPLKLSSCYLPKEKSPLSKPMTPKEMFEEKHGNVKEYCQTFLAQALTAGYSVTDLNLNAEVFRFSPLHPNGVTSCDMVVMISFETNSVNVHAAKDFALLGTVSIRVADTVDDTTRNLCLLSSTKKGHDWSWLFDSEE